MHIRSAIWTTQQLQTTDTIRLSYAGECNILLSRYVGMERCTQELQSVGSRQKSHTCVYNNVVFCLLSDVTQTNNVTAYNKAYITVLAPCIIELTVNYCIDHFLVQY